MRTEMPMPIQGGKLLKAVPWNVVQDHEARAMSNHSQTLDKLARRGGMNPTEMLKIIQDEDLFPFNEDPKAELRLIEIIAASR